MNPLKQKNYNNDEDIVLPRRFDIQGKKSNFLSVYYDDSGDNNNSNDNNNNNIMYNMYN